MKNIDVAHAFFYDASGYFDKYYINVWYKNNKYYSYNTCIGELLHTTNGTSLVLAANRFSNTTCKHKADLIKACPYPIIELPQEYEAKEFKSDVVFKFIKGNIEVYSNSKLTRKENRYEFTQAYKQLTDMLIITKFKDFTYQLNALIEHYKLLYDTLTDSALLKKELQKRREKEAEKRKLLKEELNSFIKKHSYMDIIKFTFTDKYFNDTDVEAYNPQNQIKQKLKLYLNPRNELAFVWVENNHIHTSKNITLPIMEVLPLLHVWQHNKLKHGMQIRDYVVRSVTPTYVTIGCHKIPTANLEALYTELEEVKNVA